MMFKQLSVSFGVLCCEFRMQLRRPAVWITFLCFVVLLSGFGTRPLLYPTTPSLLKQIAHWAYIVNTFLPVSIGVLLADRLPRDRHTRVNELFTTMPTALSTRLVGKYLGSTLATLVPLFTFYSIGIGAILFQSHNLLAIPIALAAFASVILPGMLFIGAFSIACPSIIWVPLYQFLFICYWFWGNLFPPGRGIPTLSNTILTPIGGYMSSAFFGVDIFPVSHATVWQGVESMLLLLGLSVLVMFVLWSFLRWQQARQ